MTDWIERAREVAAKLAVDAVERDRRGETPYQEVQLLKDTGLVTLLGPVEHGGGGQTWETAYRVIREIAKADGSIGQLLGYHYLWAWAARLVATDAQIAAVEELYTRDNLFFGGAVNPRDSDLTITEDGDSIVYNGHKSFSTGSKVSDLTVLEGVVEGTEDHIFAIVPSKQEGITFHDDWDNIGQRLTESGSVTIEDVRVPWASAAGYVDRKFQPLVYNTRNVPTIQLVVMLASMVPVFFADRAARRLDKPTVRVWLTVAAVMLIAIAVLRWFEFWSLNVRWDTNAYGSAEWNFLGWHATLIAVELGELVGMAAVMWRARVPVKFMADTSDMALYYYYLILVWVPLYVVAYWVPRFF